MTRFTVDLDTGGRLIALAGNGPSTSHEDLRRGDPVHLWWRPEHLIEVHDRGTDASTTANPTTEQRRSS